MAGREETIRYIRKKLKAGYPAGELENDLINQGYSQEEAEKLIQGSSGTHLSTGEKESGKKPETHVLTLFGITLIITGIALMSTRIWLTKYAPLMIFLGVIGAGVGYYISYRKKKGSL